ncbi:hypothetical protein PYCC9005_001140 [Savitreella phatthalungensis]
MLWSLFAIITSGVSGAIQQQPHAGWALHRISSGALGKDANAIERHDFDYTYDDDVLGKGVRLYVMGDGVQCEHVDFGGRALCNSNYDFARTLLTTSSDSDSSSPSRGRSTHRRPRPTSAELDDDDGNDGDEDDWNDVRPSEGKATQIAGTAGGATFGVCKQCTIVSVKVTGSSEITRISDVLDAMEMIAGTQNLVYWQPGVVVYPAVWSRTAALPRALEALVRKGIHVVVSGASPGERDQCNSFLGMGAEGVIGTSFTRANDTVLPWSHTGSCVSVFAPGADVYTVWWAKDRPQEKDLAVRGTAPHLAAGLVAGTLATWLSIEKYRLTKPDQMKALIQRHADANVVGALPSGTPNYLLRSLPP